MRSAVVKRVLTAIVVSIGLSMAAHWTPVRGQGLPPAGPKLFASPETAAEALIAATEAFDEKGLEEILGPGSFDLVHSGDIVQDKELANDFGRLGRAKMTLTSGPRNKRLFLLAVGDEGWPCPFPIVKRSGGWVFDANAGRQELFYRRVGRNELDAIQICRMFVEAQHAYHLINTMVHL